MRGAVFLDRDGTLVHDPGYLHDPDDVVLLAGVSQGLAALDRAGWPLVIVSNQSGIARGYYGPEAFRAVTDRIEQLLAPQGFHFAGTYYCPHHPDITGPCDCRKPGTALFHRAARDLSLDLSRSWYVGDRWHDVEPATALGGSALLLASTGNADEVARARAEGVRTARDLLDAARQIGSPGA